MQIKKKLALGLAAVAVASMSLGIPLAAFGAEPGFTNSPPDAATFFSFNGVNNVATYNIPTVAKTDPRAIISNLIGLISGFLGIIAVVLILVSGFQWMTAGGDEEVVKKAQQRLVQGVIGLILILSTWSVAYYVVNTLSKSIFGGP